MRWLLFLSRLSFICGICFLLAISIRINNWTHDETITSTIVVIGYFIGIIVVPITVLCYLIVILRRIKPWRYIPMWLVIANVLFLLALLYYIFYQNDPYYHQG